MEALHWELDRLNGDGKKIARKLMPPAQKKRQHGRTRERPWAVGLELFNEAGDILLLPKLYEVSSYLFFESVAFFAISLLMRLVNALALRSRVKKGAKLRYCFGLLLNLIEPNSGMEIIKATRLKTTRRGALFMTPKQMTM
jgi:hypothetical protein